MKKFFKFILEMISELFEVILFIAVLIFLYILFTNPLALVGLKIWLEDRF